MSAVVIDGWQLTVACPERRRRLPSPTECAMARSLCHADHADHADRGLQGGDVLGRCRPAACCVSPRPAPRPNGSSPEWPASGRPGARPVRVGGVREPQDPQAPRAQARRAWKSWMASAVFRAVGRPTEGIDPRLPALALRQGQLTSDHTKGSILYGPHLNLARLCPVFPHCAI